MKIKMTKTSDGSVDGAIVKSYEADVEYDLTRTAGERDLAQSFVDSGRATKTGDDDTAETAPAVTSEPGPAPVNIAPPDQISTNVHPADVEVNPERAVEPSAPSASKAAAAKNKSA